jgi:hypothetical protein
MGLFGRFTRVKAGPQMKSGLTGGRQSEDLSQHMTTSPLSGSPYRIHLRADSELIYIQPIPLMLFQLAKGVVMRPPSF